MSLVNTTSGAVRPVRELVPVHGITVKVKLEGKSVADHKVLQCQGICEMKTNENKMEINISRLVDFAAIHIRMNV